MATFSAKDIEIVDPISMIRKHPEMFVGDKPREHRLAARLIEDLILLHALPAHLDRCNKWWFVSADKDWLAGSDGNVSTVPFFAVIPFPQGGLFYDRAEILLTALANAVVTTGIDGLSWISGDPVRYPLPSKVVLKTPNLGRGRVVAFHFDEELQT